MLADFKAFIAKGNVLDLAVAVIIGAAFAKIVSSLTDDIIMPIVGKIFGGLGLFQPLHAAWAGPSWLPRFHDRLCGAQEGRSTSSRLGPVSDGSGQLPYSRLHHFSDGALGNKADEEARSGSGRSNRGRTARGNPRRATQASLASPQSQHRETVV